MKKLFLAFSAVLAVTLNLSVVTPSEAQTESTVYFLAAGPRHARSQPKPDASEYESFVVPGEQS